MEQYIQKSALVEEIEKWLGETDKGFPNDHNLGRYDMCKKMLSFIDGLDVKEVDLDKEIVKYEESFKHNPASMGYKDTAKHFFELGLKAQKGE